MESLCFPLDQNWTFQQAGHARSFPATVPGTVQGDLIAQGELPDPFFRQQEEEVQWVETADWVYTCRFAVPSALMAHGQIDLVCDGLDTYADVYLNDECVIQADNMYCQWETAVKDRLQAGENELRIHFHSPVRRGLEKLRALPYAVPATNEPQPMDLRTSVFTRKAPFHYGWDWGPRIVTIGPWRPIYLRAWSAQRLIDCYLQPLSVTEQAATYEATVEIVESPAFIGQLRLRVGEEVEQVRLLTGSETQQLRFTLSHPRLWWPHGLGEQPRYPVTLTLEDADGKVLDRWTHQLGVRSLRLIQRPEGRGETFYFEVNGRPVFMKGANYIPPDSLPDRVDEAAYRRVLEDARAANMNMLRVWGGAVYEDDRFYALCDEMGLLIWQDFMFACAMYPPTEDFLASVAEEARQNVRRLRNYACLALWCGNNEMLVAWHRWDWQTSHRLDAEAQAALWGGYERIFYDILPQAVATHDPARSYWPSSPSGGYRALPQPEAGDEHDWRIWFSQADFETYGVHTARFVSEYGLQAFPVWETIEAITEPADRQLDSPVMRHRQRSSMPWLGPDFTGNDMMRYYVQQYFREPRDFPALVYASQQSQALALQTGIEAHRRQMPHTMGSLYWQLDDCWPTQSWSTVDYYGRWKAAHYAVRRAFAPVLVSPVIEGEDFAVHVVSDRPQAQAGTLLMRLLTFTGEERRRESLPVEIPAAGSARVFQHGVNGFLAGADPQRCLLAVALWAGEERLATAQLTFVRPRALDLPEAQLDWRFRETEGGWELRLHSDAYMPGLWLRLENGEAHFSDNHLHMLPGEGQIIQVRPREALSGAPRLSVYSLRDSYVPGPPPPLRPADKPWSRAL